MDIDWLYGTINDKKLRINKNDCLDLYSWRECKVKDNYWQKIKPTLDTNKYDYASYRIGVNKKVFILSRVVYKLHNPDWDITNYSINNFIDHINGDPTDNKIENLRVVSDQQNKWNTRAKGYSWNNVNNKWQAQIRTNKILETIGYYSDEEDAHDAYLYAKEYLHQIKV